MTSEHSASTSAGQAVAENTARAARGSVRLERVRIADLHPAPYNPRQISPEALAGLDASVERFGLVQPVVANRRTMNVVGGHQRLRVLTDRGATDADVVFVDLPPAEEKALNIALNNPQIAGEWTPAVRELLDDVARELPDLAKALRFGDLLGSLEDAFPDVQRDAEGDVEAVPEPPDKPVTRPGDVWTLGAHRLLCGDSGKPEDLDRLLDGAAIHLLHTDPPYNVFVEPRSNNAIAAGQSTSLAREMRDSRRAKGRDTPQHTQRFDLARHPEKAIPTSRKMRAKDRHLENDCMSDEAFAACLRSWFGNAARALVPGRAFYIWGGYANIANYPSALLESGLRFSQTIIWHKLWPVLGRKDFMGDHEWCFYGWREGAGHRWFGPNNIPDVWPIRKVSHTQMLHLTEKPAELAIRACEYSSRRGENVLDLFGGSGSTMAGCEVKGRRAFLMEIDPAYCDVIVGRYEKLSGKKAQRRKGAA